jgi:hypothetical protein
MCQRDDSVHLNWKWYFIQRQTLWPQNLMLNCPGFSVGITYVDLSLDGHRAILPPAATITYPACYLTSASISSCEAEAHLNLLEPSWVHHVFPWGTVGYTIRFCCLVAWNVTCIHEFKIKLSCGAVTMQGYAFFCVTCNSTGWFERLRNRAILNELLGPIWGRKKESEDKGFTKHHCNLSLHL